MTLYLAESGRMADFAIFNLLVDYSVSRQGAASCSIQSRNTRTGLRRSPGTAVLEFFDTIPADHAPAGLLAEIERKIENASDKLAAEAAKEFEA